MAWRWQCMTEPVDNTSYGWQMTAEEGKVWRALDGWGRGRGWLQRQGVHRRSLNTLNRNGSENTYRWAHTAADLNIYVQTKHTHAHHTCLPGILQSIWHSNYSTYWFQWWMNSHSRMSSHSFFLSLSLVCWAFLPCLLTYLQPCFSQIPTVPGGGCDRHIVTTHSVRQYKVLGVQHSILCKKLHIIDVHIIHQ